MTLHYVKQLMIFIISTNNDIKKNVNCITFINKIYLERTIEINKIILNEI